MTRKPARDSRTHRTLFRLETALLDLLKTRDLEALTVQDICAHARVHRTTFYLHYRGKSDCLAHATRALIDRLVQDSPDPHDTVATYQHTHRVDGLERLFDHVDAHRPIYQRLLAHPDQSTFRRAFEAALLRLVRLRLRQLEPADVGPSIPGDLVAHFVVGAVLEVITWWLHQTPAPSSQQMAGHLADLFSRGVLSHHHRLSSATAATLSSPGPHAGRPA